MIVLTNRSAPPVTVTPVLIYPDVRAAVAWLESAFGFEERVRVGEAPPLKSGFAALYRAIGLPVVPIALNSGRLWGRGLVHRPGIVTFKVGETIPPGLKREEIEARVYAAINALD